MARIREDQRCVFIRAFRAIRGQESFRCNSETDTVVQRQSRKEARFGFHG